MCRVAVPQTEARRGTREERGEVINSVIAVQVRGRLRCSLVRKVSSAAAEPSVMSSGVDYRCIWMHMDAYTWVVGHCSGKWVDSGSGRCAL